MTTDYVTVSASPSPVSIEEIVEVLGALLRMHEPANLTPEIIGDRANLYAFINDCEATTKAAVDRARSIISRLKEMEEGKQ